MMRRREIVSGLGAAAAWPLVAGAQQSAIPVIGWLGARSPKESASVVAAFHKGLNETGYVEGRNVAVEYRWAELQYDRLPALATDLIGRHVSVIAATGGGASPLAAKAVTAALPIVFVAGDLDPVNSGLVSSLNRPGGNVTGVMLRLTVLGAKRLAFLRELVPNAVVIGVLVNPANPGAAAETKDLQDAARVLGIELGIVSASTEGALDTAFATFAQRRVGALLIGNDSFFISRREQIVARAAQHSIPTMYFVREFAAAGGLISYGTSNADAYRLVGVYVGRILKGEKPADLPIMQPTKFDLVINLKTAKALGLDMPAKLLALADEVIE